MTKQGELALKGAPHFLQRRYLARDSGNFRRQECLSFIRIEPARVIRCGQRSELCHRIALRAGVLEML
jgi:hypothetical protein